MPINADPDAIAPIVLDGDKDKPQADRPTFLFRFPTARESAKISRLLKEALSAKDDEDAAGLLDGAIAVTLTGWRNVTFRGEAMEFGRHKPSDFLTTTELFVLAGAAVTETGVQEADKKKSHSASPSGAEKSAASAPPPAAA